MKKQRLISLCLALALALSLAACNSSTDEQDSAEPTPSTQPTAEPAPTPPIPYTDVPEDAPYYDAVVWAYKNGIASDGETFDPADTCTRGQAITFLWRAMGSPEPWIMENPFDDTSFDDWCYLPALWAYQHNVAASTTVNAGNPCTRAEALTFLWRAEGEPDKLNTLAASDTYYGQPAAWADKNGLFAGTEFDPAAPCSRADLMTYLYCAAEQWTPSEEEQRIQIEYDKILYSLDDYTTKYADYVDVDNDGKVELLTLNISGDIVTAAVYANSGDHVGISCEKAFDTYGGDNFSIYRLDDQLYLCQNIFSGMSGETYDFYRIGKDAITFCEQASVSYREETSESDIAILQKYKEEKGLLSIDYYSGISVLDKGILPSWEECEKYWTAYWEASDPIYAAVLSGDFSAIAGNYEGGLYEEGEYSRNVSDVINKNGTMAGDGDLQGDGILSVTVMASGEIYVLINDYEEVDYEDGYTIYPPKCVADLGVKEDLSKVRISYWSGTDGTFVFLTKTS